MPRYYPVYLDLEGKPVIVVGGGVVAERKVTALVRAGARVRVISPEATEELGLAAGSGQIELLKRAYLPGDLSGVFLAVIATDDVALNRQAAEEARLERALVNTVDDVAYCDFIAPAVVQRGDITVAVSTNGKSPAMARFLRRQLEGFLSAEYGDLLEVLERVRKELRRRKARVPADRWQERIDDGLRDLVRRGELAVAEERLLSALTGDPTPPGAPGACNAPLREA